MLVVQFFDEEGELIGEENVQMSRAKAEKWAEKMMEQYEASDYQVC